MIDEARGHSLAIKDIDLIRFARTQLRVNLKSDLRNQDYAEAITWLGIFLAPSCFRFFHFAFWAMTLKLKPKS